MTIERLGREGDGIAGAFRLPFSLPGERWAVGNGAEAALLEAAPMRVPPPCRHFGRCGGCALQHASDAWVAAWKAETIVRALAARGLTAALRPTLTSPPESRRRAVLSARRTRHGAIVGFHGRRSETLVEVPGCLVVTPAIRAALPALARLSALAASRSTALRLTVTDGPAGLDIDVAGGHPLDARRRLDLAELAEQADFARLSCEGEIVAMRRPPLQTMGSARMVPPPGAFLQATVDGERALVAAVREAVTGARHIADLFAGCGTFSLPLAAEAEILAVEGSAAMPAALAEAARRTPGLRPLRTAARDLFRRPLLAQELAGFDAVVIDPPRAGAEAQSRQLALSNVPVIAAVSCDPATFARDAAILVAGGYRLDWLQPVDQFRWSGHIELAARFSR